MKVRNIFLVISVVIGVFLISGNDVKAAQIESPLIITQAYQENRQNTITPYFDEQGVYHRADGTKGCFDKNKQFHENSHPSHYGCFYDACGNYFDKQYYNSEDGSYSAYKKNVDGDYRHLVFTEEKMYPVTEEQAPEYIEEQKQTHQEKQEQREQKYAEIYARMRAEGVTSSLLLSSSGYKQKDPPVGEVVGKIKEKNLLGKYEDVEIVQLGYGIYKYYGSGNYDLIVALEKTPLTEVNDILREYNIEAGD